MHVCKCYLDDGDEGNVDYVDEACAGGEGENGVAAHAETLYGVIAGWDADAAIAVAERLDVVKGMLEDTGVDGVVVVIKPSDGGARDGTAGRGDQPEELDEKVEIADTEHALQLCVYIYVCVL